jgi:DNA-3-methyladenine glycosylase II
VTELPRNVFTTRVLSKFASQVPELSPAIERLKPELRPTLRAPFEMLVQSVVYQQLSGKAAKTILGRLIDLIRTISPESVLSKTEEELRSVGLSRQKASYIQNIAEAFGSGGSLSSFNSVEALRGHSSREITDLFEGIKGVGEWTVQMYLIFSLGRLDVLAPKDLGVRKGIMKLYELKEMPTPKEVERIAEKWSPFETVGTVLAWRVLSAE